MAFTKIVTTTKRNHIYFGPTESEKMAVTLNEVNVDLVNVYAEFNRQDLEVLAIASGYLGPSGAITLIADELTEIENIFERMINIQAIQPEIF
jgi:hypothetical protein